MVPQLTTSFQEHSFPLYKVSELPRRQLDGSSNKYAAMSLIPYSLRYSNYRCLCWKPCREIIDWTACCSPPQSRIWALLLKLGMSTIDDTGHAPITRWYIHTQSLHSDKNRTILSIINSFPLKIH
jgi:hypothetical protein